ncbi:hypothetical protein H4J50_13005 [Colwellia sp. 6M3]|uniref:hypothetical protein n=1 Tax=Colwellia sp. 6M3 TaxID=2759849 RepID=UPI0015F44520|nr:hypothetical protein [Colwellia sp. 6M3]MBA6416936.1 hypothetical protein [Colwellia sp. 6M3]
MIKTLFLIGIIIFTFYLWGKDNIVIKKNCIPKLSLQISPNTSFVLIDLEGSLKAFVERNAYEPQIAFQMEINEIPSNISYIETDEIHLLGTTIKYIKSKFNPFATSETYFYSNIGGRLVWLSYMELLRVDSLNQNFNKNKLSNLIGELFKSIELDKSLICNS